MTTETIQYCEETRLANGITHLRLIDNSLQSCDAFLDFLDQYISALEPHQAHPPLLLIVEVSPVGTPPLAYISRCYQDLLKLHATKQFHARIAYLYGSNMVISLVLSFFALIRNAKYVKRRFFRPHERAQAEAWVLEEA
jgi:hypothetical protein